MMNDTLLVELLTEELPPRSLVALGLSLRDTLQKSLAEAGFIAADCVGEWFATPRRLTVRFAHCQEMQPDRVIEKKGPAVAAGLDADGAPSKALAGFLRAAGANLADLQRSHDGKAEYFVVRTQKNGERIDAHLPALIEAALKKMPVARLMRWGAGEAQFVRPVHGVMLLHGARIIPGTVLGVASRNVTRGHRFMSVGVIEINHADRYVELLETRGRVIVDFFRRRDMIRQQLDAAAAARGLDWLHDEALLDEVTALVEHPSVYEAQFDAAFLAVPAECLILTMKANQKYFPLMGRGEQAGQLTNRFLLVSNMALDNPEHIISGNARVVRPRLADARFFFETDKKTPLAARLASLDRVVYHNKLGSQGERVARLVVLAGKIATRLGADTLAAERAALLAKADLGTDMVGEFPELQGIMGRYYALADGEDAQVAAAIAAHYHPRFNGDSLPQGLVACTVALAERLDALAGFFGIGQIPTGDKDPFALRRAALGILRILMETPLALDLDELCADADAGFAGAVLSVAADERRATKSDFLRERLRHLLREQGHAQNAVDAVLALHPGRIDQVPARLAAVKAFAELPEAAALAAANKRIVNLLRKVDATPQAVDTGLLHEPAEQALSAQLAALTPRVEAHLADGDYRAALVALAGLREAVDAFFDAVMVMAEDAALRANRLALLAGLAALMNRVADISRL